MVFGPLAHVAQPVSFAPGCFNCRSETFAVIGDHDFNPAPVGRRRDANFAGGCMFERVGQGFLDNEKILCRTSGGSAMAGKSCDRSSRQRVLLPSKVRSRSG